MILKGLDFLQFRKIYHSEPKIGKWLDSTYDKPDQCVDRNLCVMSANQRADFECTRQEFKSAVDKTCRS